jgi:hypothetical protein
MREEPKKLEVEAGATEGGRRPTGVTPADMMTGGLAPGQLWSVARCRPTTLSSFPLFTPSDDTLRRNLASI